MTTPALSVARRHPATLAGAILVLVALASIPLIPAIGGVPAASGAYPVLAEIPPKTTGAYVAVPDGYVKLFSWTILPEQVPDETPAFAASELAGIVVAQKALDDPGQYRIFSVADGSLVHITRRVIEPGRRLGLEFAHPLEPGDYMVDVPIGGMFAGRERFFFRVGG